MAVHSRSLQLREPASRTTLSSTRARARGRKSTFDKSSEPTSEHYLPNQGLFDREGITHLLFDEEDQEDNFSGGEESGGIQVHQERPSSRQYSTPLRGSSLYNERVGTHSVRQQAQRNDNQALFAMLQQQQALLQEVLSQQEAMSEKQKALDEKVQCIEERLAHNLSSSTSVDSSPGSSSKRRRVTRDLTNLVASVHDLLEEGFHPNESSTTHHNSLVKKTVIKKICDSPALKYDEEQVKCAVQRKYESMRRQWVMDGKEGRDEISHIEAQRKKYRARRQRKYQNRMLVVKPSEMKLWNQLTLDYMTEESDDPDDSSIILEHRLLWRSDRLEEFLRILDQRYEAKAKKDKGVMAKKSRVTGIPSSTQPPINAPAWTMKDAGDNEENTDPVLPN